MQERTGSVQAGRERFPAGGPQGARGEFRFASREMRDAAGAVELAALGAKLAVAGDRTRGEVGINAGDFAQGVRWDGMSGILAHGEALHFSFRRKILLRLDNPVSSDPAEDDPLPAPQVSTAQRGLFLLAVFYTIYLTRSLLLPVVLATMLTYLLAPVVRLGSKLRLPRALSAAVIVLGLLAALGFAFSTLVEPAAGWLEKAPVSFKLLQKRIRPLKDPVKKVTEASAEMEKITQVETDAPAVQVKEKPMIDKLMESTPAFLAGLLTTIILLFFMLSYEDQFLRNVIRVMPTLKDKQRAANIARDINRHVSRYLLTITAINAGLGVCVGLAMWALGLPNPMLWGVLAALLNFVPYLGAITGIVIMGLAAVLSYPSFAWAMVFPATYFVLTTIEGNIVTPMILGRSFTMSPIFIIFGLLFWTWLWGIPGTLLAVPILVTFQIFCTHIEKLRPFRELMEK